MRKNTVALFDDRETAEKAIEDLVWEGFERQYIRVLSAEGEAEVFREQIAKSGSFVGEGAVSGLVWGAVLGGILGWAIGSGFLLPPGSAPGVAQGLVAGLVTGALIGGGVGIARGFGVPAQDGDLYEQHVVHSQTLVVVESEEASVPILSSFLESRGAHDIRIVEVLDPGHTVQTTSHAYADVPAGNAPIAGERVDTADTMGGTRPRYGSLDA